MTSASWLARFAGRQRALGALASQLHNALPMRKSIALTITFFTFACGADQFSSGGEGGAPTSSAFADSPTSQGSSTVKAGQLTAGEWDDNSNFAHFTSFLAEFAGPGSYQPEGRVVIRVEDASGNPVGNTRVEIKDGTRSLLSAPTGTDGRLLFMPNEDGAGKAEALSVTIGGLRAPVPSGDEWVFTMAAPGMGPTARLDLAFVVDATGSMGDELNYLTAEVEAIATRVAALHADVEIRYAMVVYRDVGDAYVTRKVPFTNLTRLVRFLRAQEAGGGGDYPEAMDAALGDLLQMEWSTGPTARVAFIIADAPPHAEKAQDFLRHVKTARQQGIRLYPVAASGVANEAERLMRIAAQQTMGRYMFITDDSGIGNSHAEPHIPCYQVQYLNDLMVRAIGSEVAGQRLPAQGEIIREVGEPVDGVCTNAAGQQFRL